MNRRSTRGQALVEFAIVAPLLLILLFGTMHFGYAFYTYDNLQKAVRDGARFAARRTYGPADAATWERDVKRMVVYGNLAGVGDPVVHALAPGQVDVSVTPAAGPPKFVTVRINGYALPSMLPGVAGITLTNKPVARFPFVGRWIP